MRKTIFLTVLLVGLVLTTTVWPTNAEATPPCPAGYFLSPYYGCIPYEPAPPPPPAYYPPQPCPPGTYWSYGACRPAAPRPGITIPLPVPPIYIGP